jgi:hypothetical protein
MKLFLDRNKTLLPRVDNIYFLTRILTLAGLIWFGIFHDYPRSEISLVVAILVTFVIHLVTFFLAIKETFDIKLAYHLRPYFNTNSYSAYRRIELILLSVVLSDGLGCHLRACKYVRCQRGSFSNPGISWFNL